MEEAQITIACGVVVVADGRILLVKHVEQLGGQYSIPKGALEPSESLRSCALRELKEETGLVLWDTDLSLFPEVLHIMDRQERVLKRVYYFVARVDLRTVLARGESMRAWDTKEVESIHFLTFAQAEAVLPFSQLSVLHHLNHRFSSRELLFLLRLKLIHRHLDLVSGLYIYNYSQRCKAIQYWNYTTLSCRGLVLDRSLNVIARPFKKFFEWRKLPAELQAYLRGIHSFIAISAFDKLDGSLVVLFHHDGKWHLTNRRRFDLIQSHDAQTLFHKSCAALVQLDTTLTYLFESTEHYNYNVITYVDKSLIFLCAVRTSSGRLHLPKEFDLPFKTPAKLVGLTLDDEPIGDGKEGHVSYLNNEYIIKAKSSWFCKNHERLLI